MEDNNLLDVDARRFINIISSDAMAVYWRPRFCTTCSKPMVLHNPLQQNRCQRLTITQAQRTRYERACKNNDTMSIAAEIIAATVREDKASQQPTPIGANAKHYNRTKLSEWSKEESWEAYNMTFEMYNKASEKKPAGKFNDHITALKKSGRTDLTKPLLQEMMPK